MYFSQVMKKGVLAIAVSVAGSVYAAPTNLSYDYLELKGGVGKLGVDVTDFRENIRTTDFSGRWSGMITENIYSSLSLSYLSAEDDKSFPGQKYNLETTQSTYAVIVGGAFGVAASTDVFAGLGVGGINQDSELEKTFLNKTTTQNLDVKKTDLAWEFGIRREFWQQGFELEAVVEGIAEQTSLTVSAPVFINENLALTPGFTLMEEDTVELYKNHSVVNLGLRFNF